MGTLLNVSATFDPEIYQLETADPVEGGPTGVDNLPHRQLAARTLWLKGQVEAIQTALDKKAHDIHSHSMDQITGLEAALQNRAARVHTHAQRDIQGLAEALGDRHKKRGDEVHEGRFKVTAPPEDDQDVIRLQDLREQAVKANASLVSFACPLPQKWGSPVQILTLSRKAESGTDVKFAGDPTMILMETAGYYELRGHTSGEAGPSAHDTRWELWLRPAGTTGSQDRVIAYNTFSNDQGGAPLAVYHLWASVPGDRIYLKANTKRGLSLLATVSYLGQQAATQPLTITTSGWSGSAANGQVYPKLVDVPLATQNATGAVTWAITGGTAQAFATLSGARATLSLPGVGTWTLQVRARDAAGGEATKSLNISLSEYALVPLVITSGDQSFTSIGYPYSLEVPLASTGGDAPVLWSLVAGANTTLPGAATSGGTLTAGVSAAGSWTVEVQATDSASTPQTVTKVITVAVDDYAGGGGPGDLDPWTPVCFEAEETYVLLEDGTGKLLSEVQPGETVWAVYDRAHLAGLRSAAPALVTDKTLREAPQARNAVLVNGCKATPGHPFCVPKDLRRAEALKDGDLVMVLKGDRSAVEPRPAETAQGDSPVMIAANLKTRLGTYFVGPTPEGPWTLVHNFDDYSGDTQYCI